MLSSPVLIASILTWLLMLAAYLYHRPRIVHVAVMVLCICYDIAVPFILYFTRNWPHRLIEQGGIFNYLVWMHVVLDILLFTLYVMQIREGVRLWQGGEGARATHRQQAKVIMAVRLLALVSGGLLAP